MRFTVPPQSCWATDSTRCRLLFCQFLPDTSLLAGYKKLESNRFGNLAKGNQFLWSLHPTSSQIRGEVGHPRENRVGWGTRRPYRRRDQKPPTLRKPRRMGHPADWPIVGIIKVRSPWGLRLTLRDAPI